MAGSYVFPSYGMAGDSALASSGSLADGAGAAAAGSGINWGQVGVSAGASALTGILSAMYQAEQERKKKVENAQKAMSDTAGQHGQNQNNIMAQMMSNWQQSMGA